MSECVCVCVCVCPIAVVRCAGVEIFGLSIIKGGCTSVFGGRGIGGLGAGMVWCGGGA